MQVCVPHTTIVTRSDIQNYIAEETLTTG